MDEAIRPYEQLGASDERGFLNKSRYLKGANIWGDELGTTLQTAIKTIPGAREASTYRFGAGRIRRDVCPSKGLGCCASCIWGGTGWIL